MNFEKEILQKVKRISKTHKGGEEFFDKLDGELVNEASNEMIAHLLEMVPNKYVTVLSGGFGVMVASKIDSGELTHCPYILLKGGIRSGKSPEIIRKTSYHGKRAIFLDDSIYGGATYQTIKQFLATELDIKIEKCCVVYDGSPVKKKDIVSIFRYYDHFSSTPNFSF